jgi:acetyl esterase/lipase
MLSGYLSEIIIGSPAPFAADQSPINLLTAEYPPTFIMVAEADQLIPPSHSKDIHKKLEELGVPVEMAIAREMQHGEAEAMQGTERWSEELGLGWWEEAIVPSLQFAMRHL